MSKSKLICIAMIIAMILVVMTAGCTQTATQVNTTTTTTAENQSITFTDSYGNVVTLPKVAERVVLLNSDATETMIAIGAKDLVVGVRASIFNKSIMISQLPKAVTSLGAGDPSVETIIALHPDVVIVYANPANQPKNIDLIKAANITVVGLDCYKLDTMANDARALGIITGHEAQANEYAGFIEKYLSLVDQRVATLNASQKPSVYWESGDYSTVGKGSGGDTMVTRSGGVNILGDNATIYPKVSAEFVTAKNPEYIFKIYYSINTTQQYASVYNTLAGRVDVVKGSALKNNKIYVLSDSLAFGPRSVVGLLYMAKIMHPGLFTDVNPEKILDEYTDKYLPGANKGVFIYPTPA